MIHKNFRPALQWRVLSLVLLLVFNTGRAQRIGPCPSDDTTFGYSTLGDIRLDIEDEVTRISNDGEAPQPPYIYPLCPQQQFSFQDGDAFFPPLEPVLDQSLFVCGIDGTGTGCEFVGGQTQFLFSQEAALSVINVTFQGVSFNGFTETSMEMQGSRDSVMVEFENCSWSGFTSTFVVNMSNPFEESTSNGPTVRMTDCSITEGSAGVGISNNGGALTANDLSMSGVTMASGIAGANAATTSLIGFSVQNSDIMMVVSMFSLAVLSVQQSSVVNNRNLQDVFAFTGPETSDVSELVNVTIVNNQASGSPWNGVSASMGVSVRVEDCTFSDNTNMEIGVSVSQTSSATISQTTFSGNIGTGPDVSALVLAISDSSLEITEVFFRDNLNYTSSAFAIFRSSLALASSCIIGGEADTAVFVGQNSTFEGVDSATNFILGYPTMGCNTTGSNRLFFEDQGSMCFRGGECNGTCRDMASSPICVLDNTTAPPTDSPAPVVPTEAPVVQGPTTPPVDGTTFAPATLPPVDGTTLAPAGPTAPPVGGPTAGIPTEAPVVQGPTTPPVGGPTAVIPTEAPVVQGPTAPPVAGPTAVIPTEAPVVLGPTTTPVAGPTAVIPTEAPVQAPTISPVAVPTITVPTENPVSPVTTTVAPVQAPTPSIGGAPSVSPVLPPAMPIVVSPVPIPLPTLPPMTLPTRSPTMPTRPTKTPNISPIHSPAYSPVWYPSQEPPSCSYYGKGKKSKKDSCKSKKSKSKKSKGKGGGSKKNSKKGYGYNYGGYSGGGYAMNGNGQVKNFDIAGVF